MSVVRLVNVKLEAIEALLVEPLEVTVREKANFSEVNPRNAKQCEAAKKGEEASKQGQASKAKQARPSKRGQANKTKHARRSKQGQASRQISAMFCKEQPFKVKQSKKRSKRKSCTHI